MNYKDNFVELSNLETIPGKQVVEYFGIVSGSTVQSVHFGKDLFASFKNLFGGELKSYTDLLNKSRDEALSRMVAQAKSVGANAVLNVRFTTSAIASGAAELVAYGTAVKVS